MTDSNPNSLVLGLIRDARMVGHNISDQPKEVLSPDLALLIHLQAQKRNNVEKHQRNLQKLTESKKAAARRKVSNSVGEAADKAHDELLEQAAAKIAEEQPQADRPTPSRRGRKTTGA